MSIPQSLPSRPAANARSPRRKPRTRLPIKKAMRQLEWELFLKVYALSGYDDAIRAICDADPEDDMKSEIKRAKARIFGYVNDDPEHVGERKRAWATAKSLFLEGLEPRLHGMTDKSFNVVSDILDNEDPKFKALALDAAKAHLKGVRVYSEKQLLELPKDIEITVRYADSDKKLDSNAPQTA